MKIKGQIVLLLAVFCSFLFIASGAVHAAAPVLSLEATTDGSTEATDFLPGQPLYININVDNPTGIAGAAFTLEYDPTVVTAPATKTGQSDSYYDGTPVNPGDITSLFPFTFQNEEMHRENSDETGKVYFSGATIDPTDGGSIDPATTDHTLFTIKFTVVDNPANIGKTFNFNLKQTELMNPDAGYGNDVDGDGVYDPADGDIKDSVPVLVGAVDDSDQTLFNDFDCSDGSCAFPVMLGDENNVFAGVSLPADLSVVSGPSVSGTISYDGPQTGDILIGLFSSDTFSAASLVAGTAISSPGAYSIANVPAGNGYYLKAFRDSDSGSSLNDPISIDVDDTEAQGSFGSTIDVASSSLTGKDFAISDPVDPDTGEPLFYENWKTNNGWTNIGAATDDFDADGYTNLQEYLNGTDPTVQNEAGGTGYNCLTDDRMVHGTRSAASFTAGGEDVTISVTLEYTGSLTALAVEETIPQGWTFKSVGGTNPPGTVPTAGDTGTLEFVWVTIPDSPAVFTYTITAPATPADTNTVTGLVRFRGLAEEETCTITASSLDKSTYHSSDYNPADWTINVSELLRAIQIYNVGSYHCDPAGEDGYALGAGDQTCKPHSSDYNPQDWSINVSELLRLIQIYNVGSYHVDTDGEDGFALGSGS